MEPWFGHSLCLLSAQLDMFLPPRSMMTVAESMRVPIIPLLQSTRSTGIRCGILAMVAGLLTEALQCFRLKPVETIACSAINRFMVIARLCLPWIMMVINSGTGPVYMYIEPFQQCTATLFMSAATVIFRRLTCLTDL